MRYQLFVMLLVLLPTVSAVSINDYLDTFITEPGYVVLGDDAPGTDTLAVIDITSGLHNYNNFTHKYEGRLASSQPTGNLIIIGNPCENEALDMDCTELSTLRGNGIVFTYGDHLNLVGKTANDRRSLGKIIHDYQRYDLDHERMLLIDGDLVAEENTKSICGDNYCETGENCLQDCTTCEERCSEQGFKTLGCTMSCTDVDLGIYGCFAPQTCCCQKETTNTPVNTAVKPTTNMNSNTTAKNEIKEINLEKEKPLDNYLLYTLIGGSVLLVIVILVFIFKKKEPEN